ncbi:serine hydrolase [Idiomarina ramblicola]|uniref:Serine hydrolase n=1 Tax=Idiomarina ramblicola TaxID=263724 RepID=A0A432Z065_9GAMM|nr:serine hydrolase [Idiomarina ramblicola]RUO69572.1 hypothetical protein CWI78_06520 [Idiomarina ramblicola]
MKSVFLSTLLLLAMSHAGFAAPKSFQELEPRISELLREFKGAGLAIGVVKNNEIVYADGFGMRDLENQKPVEPETIFPIGSITKSFTSTLIGMLDSESQISLDSRPGEYVSGFSFANHQMNELVSVSDLLSHRSGLGNQGTSEILFPDDDMLEVVHRIKHLEPQGKVLDSFAYSNMAYTLAAVIYEQVADESWETALNKRIFTPLNMTRTFSSLEEMKTAQNYALPYGIYDDEIVDLKFEAFNSIRPAGAVKSTVVDLANWIRVWMSGGEFGGKQVIPSDFVRNATRLQNTKQDRYEADAFLQGEGFGWRLRSSYGKFRVEHGGNTFGFSSVLAMFPFDDFGVVILTNQDNSLLPHIVLDVITRHHFGLPEIENYPISVTPVYRPNLETKAYRSEQPLSYPLEKYTGAYDAAGYGKVRVELIDGRLYLRFPEVTFHLEHLGADSFYMEGTSTFDDVYNPEFKVSFRAIGDGKLVLELHSQSQPIVFSGAPL